MEIQHIRKVKDLTQENFELLFKQHFKDPNLKVTEVINEQLDKGEHYTSEVKTMVVKIEGKDDIRLFIKEPLMTFLGKLAKLQLPFAREVFWYMEAYPALSATYPEISGTGPNCFLARSDHDSDYSRLLDWKHQNGFLCSMIFTTDQGLVLLEDLKDPKRPQGPLKSINKSVPPSIHIVKLVMKFLATFHGVWSSWFKQQNPAKIGGLDKDQVIKAFTFPIYSKQMVKAEFKPLKSFENQMTMLEKPTELIQAFRHFRKNMLFDAVNCCHPQNSKLVTLVHGDAWNNNFLVNEDETEITFLDYQVFNYSHPGRDFWYYLYNQTDVEWRKNHLEECYKTYFETMEKYLPNTDWPQMTFEEFKADMESKRAFGLSFSFMMIPMMIDYSGNWSKFDGSFKQTRELTKYTTEIFKTPMKEDEDPSIKEINKRLLENIEEAFELGVFKPQESSK